MEEMMTVSKIQTRSPFKDLFDIDPVVLKAIEDDMKENGFDESASIVLWKEGNVVIDGHTRLQAAKNIGLKKVWVTLGDFDEGGAIEYAVHNQRNRRNITDAAILKCVIAIDKRRTTGRHRRVEKDIMQVNNIPSQGHEKDTMQVNNIPSHLQTAISVGTSPTKIQKARMIVDSKNEEVQEEVLEGRKTLHAASEEIRKGKIKEPLLVAHKELERDIKKVIEKAIRAGISKEQIKQVVENLLKSGMEN